MVIKTFHEAPKSIFHEIQKITDGDYALVHLFEEDKEYLELFKEAREKGREIILDNSVFELGEAFDPERFLYWINELKPTYYIVPDVLEDADGTINNMAEWIGLYKDRVTCDAKMIGVVQGKNYEDIKRCYLYMDKGANVDKIAISFDYSYYEELVPHKSKLVSWMMGRIAVLNRLEKEGVINQNKPHHLLGCSLPQEFQFYSDQDWIDSVDTSNPVVVGMNNDYYNGDVGMYTKPSVKLYTLINEKVTVQQLQFIKHNVGLFRKYCNIIRYH